MASSYTTSSVSHIAPGGGGDTAVGLCPSSPHSWRAFIECLLFTGTGEHRISCLCSELRTQRRGTCVLGLTHQVTLAVWGSKGAGQVKGTGAGRQLRGWPLAHIVAGWGLGALGLRSWPATVPARALPRQDPLTAVFSRPPQLPLLPTEKLAALRLEVEEMALTSTSQRRKLAVVLDAVNRSLQVEEQQVPWSVEGTSRTRTHIYVRAPCLLHLPTCSVSLGLDASDSLSSQPISVLPRAAMKPGAWPGSSQPSAPLCSVGDGAAVAPTAPASSLTVWH